ncbi:MAG: hypothetical protein U0N14_06805, partial [Akkermansia muciniphila]
MIINTTAGKTYAVTPQTDCTVSTTEGVLIASCAAGEQMLFVAPGAEVEVSDDSALVTESFKGAPAGLSAVWGSIKKVSASLASKLNSSTFNAHKADTTVHVTAQEREMWNGKQDKLTDSAGNMTLAGGLTAAGAVNANGGINIPLAVGAATDTSAVNRLYAAGLAAVTDAFSVRCYPLLADCSSSNGTVFKTDREPNSLYFNVPPNSVFTVKCGLVTNARPMHNYSSIRGWVAPLRLPSVSTKFTARFGQMTTVA